MTPILDARTPATKARFAGRRTLAGCISFALFTLGLSAWAVAPRTVDRVQVSDLALTAAQQTPVGTYSNAQAKITVTKKVSGSGADQVTSFVADVTLGDTTALKSWFARNTYGKNITESPVVMAQNAGAILAINADYYGFRDTGIVVRNGVAYRDRGARQGLAIYRDGTVSLYDETRTTAAQLVANGAWQTLSFGPGLVENGKILSGIDRFEIADFGTVPPGALGSIQGNQPRTGIGVIGKNHFVFIVVDGRSNGYSRGVTMPEFAQMFLDQGSTLAYNLDGGGSATMYFNGSMINRPSQGGDRATSDIIYIAR